MQRIIQRCDRINRILFQPFELVNGFIHRLAGCLLEPGSHVGNPLDVSATECPTSDNLR